MRGSLSIAELSGLLDRLCLPLHLSSMPCEYTSPNDHLPPSNSVRKLEGEIENLFSKSTIN